MRLEMGGINHDHFGFNIVLDQFLQDAGENPHLAPAKPAVIKGLVGPIVSRGIPPP